MDFARELLDALLPADCAGCGSLAGDGRWSCLCGVCGSGIPQRLWPVSRPISGIGSSHFLVPYAGLGGQLVRVGKYGNRPRLVGEMARMLVEGIPPGFPQVDGVVAVPSPWRRVVARGFSAPHILAASLATRLDVPHWRTLSRSPGLPQAGQERKRRWENAWGTVRVRGIVEPDCVILLVDDVVTTGASASACAHSLLLAGARAVHFVAFASALS